ncbi:hypothetical protein DFH09DRAFT_1170799, partial [Mycena vulgaris]
MRTAPPSPLGLAHSQPAHPTYTHCTRSASTPHTPRELPGAGGGHKQMRGQHELGSDTAPEAARGHQPPSAYHLVLLCGWSLSTGWVKLGKDRKAPEGTTHVRHAQARTGHPCSQCSNAPLPAHSARCGPRSRAPRSVLLFRFFLPHPHPTIPDPGRPRKVLRRASCGEHARRRRRPARARSRQAQRERAGSYAHT